MAKRTLTRPSFALVMFWLLVINAYGGDPYEGQALEGFSEVLLQKAEGGDAKAQYNLGMCYDGMGMGTSPNHEEAFKWFKKSAEQGNAFGEMNLGRCYDMGIGTGINYREAVRWYKKSADQGNAMGMSCLSASYNNGTGVDRNYGEASKWATKASAKGDTSNSQSIGFQKSMIRQQEEVEKNPSKTRYEKTDDFTFVDADNSDGDTVSIRNPEGRIITCQLLGVDACENDDVIQEQVEEQANYFGITNEQAIEIGKQAKAFNEKVLRGKDGMQKLSIVSMPFRLSADNYNRFGGKDGPFDPYWNLILDGDIVINEESLSCLLVKNGLARIHGVVPSSSTFLYSRAKLEQLEVEAQKAGVGGWGMAKAK